MKQHVDLKQVVDLSDKGFNSLKMAFYPPHYQLQVIDNKVIEPTGKPKKVVITNETGMYVYFTQLGEFVPLPNIGQMIEYLLMTEGNFSSAIDNKLCDKLWDMVKERLENEK